MRRLTTPTALGPITLVASDEGLRGVYFDGHRVQPERALLGDEAPDDVLLGDAAAQLVEWLAGDRTGFDQPLDPSPRSALEADVWQLLQRIDFGATTTYGALARELGDPHLAQAVGGAVGRNPLSIVIPCHRVVGGDGSYTGFAGGESRKAWLLAHEAYLSGASLLPPEPWRADG